MQLTDKRISTFLFAVQGVGVVFAAFFLVAYLGGLPSTNVLHSEAAFRIPLAILGVVLLVLVLLAVVLSVYRKNSLAPTFSN